MKFSLPVFRPLAVVMVLALLLAGGIVWGRLSSREEAALVAEAAGVHPDFEVEVRGHGRAVIFIPGLSTPGEIWGPTVAALGDSCQTHVLTVAGFGGARPTGVTPILPRVRDEIIAYARALRLDHPVLIGHSLGGCLALWVAATAPDLPGRAVIIDAVPFAPANRDPSITVENARQRIAPVVARYRAAVGDDLLDLQRPLIANWVNSPAEAERIAQMSARSHPPTIARALEEMISLDLRPDLGRITCPVRVLGALADKTMFASREAAADNIRTQYNGLRGVRFTFFPDSRHFVMVDEPRGCAQALREEIEAR